MRKAAVIAITEEPIDEIWKEIKDVKNWDKLIKFVKKIYISDPVKEGTYFYDITAILVLPTPIKHKIVKIEKYKKFWMEAYLPFGSGKMFQTIDIKNKNGKKEVKIEIKFYISFFLFDWIFGPILEIRLKQMIVQTLEKLDNKIRAKNLKKGISRKSEIILDR